MLREIYGCLACRIRAANHIDSFAFVRESIARSTAIIDTCAVEPVDSPRFKPTPLDSGRNHQRMAGDLIPVRQFNETVRPFGPDGNRLQRRQDFDAETLSLDYSAARQIAAAEADRKSEIV